MSISLPDRKQIPADPVARAIHKIRRERRRLSSLPPEQALREILNHPTPAPLVHSFPEEELRFFLYDIGLEDGLEILSLASDHQWEYLLDADIWEKDRLCSVELDRWLRLLSQADADRLCRWLTGGQRDLFLYYLNRRVRVTIREHDQDPAELGGDFLSWDDMLYFRFSDDPSNPSGENDAAWPETAPEGEWETVLEQLLRRIAEMDLHLFQRLLLGAGAVIPSEVEEELYRLRTVRLAEKGFQPREEAAAIYQPLPPARLRPRELPGNRTAADSAETGGYPVPWSAARSVDGDSLLGAALAALAPGPEADALRRELAGLCNCLIMADDRKVRERTDLTGIVSKAAGFIGLGIQALPDPPSSGLGPETAVEAIRKYSLPDLFRLGYARVMNLKWRAESWRKSAWYERRGLALTFWDEQWVGVLGGLLLPRPRYYDPARPEGGFYREFASGEDLRRTGLELDALMTADRLLSDMGLELSREGNILVKEQLVTWKNLLLTFWARHMLELPDGLLAMSLEDFRRFHRLMWAPADDGRWGLRPGIERIFLSWAASRCRVAPEDIPGPCRNLFHRLFQELAEEFLYLPPEEMDIRYIHMFLVS
ncbi:MAG: hypothetical protein CSB33_02730 [Desulfobacterales bacterium]|nr:MAG: hypothetical protein CSB33_02730 [Desulfobacterales bacterium]